MLLVKCDIHWIIYHHIWGVQLIGDVLGTTHQRTIWKTNNLNTHIHTHTQHYFIFVQSCFAIKIKYVQTGWINLNTKKRMIWFQNNYNIHKSWLLLLFIIHSIMLGSQELWSTCMKKNPKEIGTSAVIMLKYVPYWYKKKYWIITIYDIARLCVEVEQSFEWNTKKRPRFWSLYMTYKHTQTMLIPSHNVMNCKTSNTTSEICE